MLVLSHFSCVRLFATPWTVACQAPLSTGFSRQESWSGLPFPSPGGLPNPGVKPQSPALQADSLPSEPPGKPKDTGVGNLSLLQGNFLSQELHWRLLGCHGKESACNVGDPYSIPGLGRSPGEGNGNPLQDSCLENPMDRGACWTTVHSIAKSWT